MNSSGIRQPSHVNESIFESIKIIKYFGATFISVNNHIDDYKGLATKKP